MQASRRSRSSSPNKLSNGRTPLQSKDLNTIVHSNSSKSLLQLKSSNNSTPTAANNKAASNSLYNPTVNPCGDIGLASRTRSPSRSKSTSPMKRTTPSSHIYNHDTLSSHSLTSLNDPMSLSISSQYRQNQYSNSAFSIPTSEKSPTLSSTQIPNLPSSESPSSIASYTSIKESPTKRRQVIVAANTLPFKIFEDPPLTSPRSAELISNFKDVKIGKMDILQEQDENIDIHNSNKTKSLSPSKEDRLKNKGRKALNSNHRKPLGDLHIRQFPGFVQSYESQDQQQQDSVLQPKHQLNSSWMINFDRPNDESIESVLNVPSYITPPKEKNHYRYITSLDENSKSPSKKSPLNDTTTVKKRQHSFSGSDDLNLKSVKKNLKFCVFDDRLQG